MVSGKWFVSDTDMLSSPKQADSWFFRLSAVMKSLVMHWLRIRNKYSIPGGVPYDPTEKNCALLLLHIPTPPTSNSLYPPFEIENYPIEKWTRNSWDDDDAHAPIKDSVVDAHEFKMSVKNIEDESRDLPFDDLNGSIKRAELSNNQTFEVFKAVTAEMENPPQPPLKST